MVETLNGHGSSTIAVRVQHPNLSGRRSNAHIFPAAGLIMEEQLQAIKAPPGEYRLIAVNQMRQTSAMPFKVVGITSGRPTLTVRIKPGDNSTTWTYELCVPYGVDVYRIEEALRQLRRDRLRERREKLQQESEDEEEEVVHITSKTGTDEPKPHSEPASETPVISGWAAFKANIEKVEQAMKRSEMRAKRSAELAELRREKAETLRRLEAEIEAIDEEELRLMQEEEQDAEAKTAAETLMKITQMFSQPGASSQ